MKARCDYVEKFQVPELASLALTTVAQENHSDRVKRKRRRKWKENAVKSRKKVEVKREKAGRLRIIRDVTAPPPVVRES
jgi:hypothetical protein